MGLTLPQPPGWSASHEDHIKYSQDLHRALKNQLDKIVGAAGNSDVAAGSGAVTEQLGLTVKPQILAQCYDVTSRFNLDGYPTDRNGLLEYFNPGNAGVAYVTTVALNNIDSTTSPFSQTNKFAVEFRGIYHAATAGQYFFALDVDGVAELLIDGVVIASKYTASTRVGNLTASSGSVALVAGFHNLVMRWLEGTPGGSPGAQAGVQVPTDSSPVPIPAADLGHYTGGLEAGAPTNNPAPQAATTTDTGSTSYITHLPWTYTQPAPGGSAKLADGFIIYFEEGTTGNPSQNQQKIAVTSLAQNFTWPKNRVTSYAIASYRKTENGEEVGPKQTTGSWQGVVSTAPVTIDNAAGSPTTAVNVGTAGNANINSGGNMNVNSGGNLTIKSGGNMSVVAGGAMLITGATVTIASSGEILIAGGKIVIATGQSIDVQSIDNSIPARVRFQSAGGTTLAEIFGQFDPVIPTEPNLNLYPSATGTGVLFIGQNGIVEWGRVEMGAGDVIINASGSVVAFNNPGGGPTGANVGIGKRAGFGGGNNVLGFALATAVPTVAIAAGGGGVLYVDPGTGNLMFWGTSGVARLVAAA